MMLRRLRLGMAAALAVLTLGGMASADPSPADRVAAETLFSEAGKLYQAGRYAEACTKLADSQRLDPAVGTLLNLARCYQKLGRTATAWLTFLDAAAAAKTAKQFEREKLARESAEALVPTLPNLVIELPADAEANRVEVKRDGTDVPKGLWNTPSHVDPGDHEIVCAAPGKKSWTARVRAEPNKTTRVAIPSLESAPETTATTKKPVSGGSGKIELGTGSRQDPEADRPSGLGARRVVALATLGAGVAGIAVGSGFGLGAIADRNATQENGRCEGAFCTQEGLKLYDDAHQKATISTVAFGIGGAAIVAGAILWFTAPSRSRSEPRTGWQRVDVAVAPAVGPQGGTLVMTGAW